MDKVKDSNNLEALKSLSAKYEDVLEAHIKVLYMKIVQFIAASQLPLVHVNAVLDLVKRDLLKQLKDSYFPTEKK